MTRLILTEIRRSPGLLLFPLFVVSHVGVVWQDADFWVGDWHATSLQVQFGNVLLGPLVTACAAWAGGRESRRGYGTLAATMPRPQAGPVVLQWAATTFWALLAYLVGLAFAASKTAPVAVAGGPWPSYVVLGAVTLCGLSAVGYSLGRLLRWRIVAPLAGIGVYAYYVISVFQNDWFSRLSLLHWDILASPGYRLRVPVVAILLLWAAGLGIVALVAAGTRRVLPVLRATLISVAALPAAGAILAAALLGGGDFVQRPAPDREMCEGSAPRVCMWPEHAKWADDAARVAHDLFAALDGVIATPSTVYEQGLPGAPARGGPVVRVDTIPVTPPSFVSGLTADVLPALPPSCPTHGRQRLERFVLVKAWMQMRGAGQLGPDVMISNSGDLEALLRLSPPRQAAWVRDNLPFLTRCSAPLPPSNLQASGKPA